MSNEPVLIYDLITETMRPVTKEDIDTYYVYMQAYITMKEFFEKLQEEMRVDIAIINRKR